MSLEPIKHAQPYNFGPYAEDSLTVEEMTQLAISLWGDGTYEAFKSEDQPHEAGLLRLDICKSTHELGWKPKLTAATAVELTINWYKCFYKNPINIASYTQHQIHSFFNQL